ncbi:MAG: CehA/McbA family metallohydrolase [Proteobacteria bacterium]|nr:CehA/McbA family metallohydrolase [Pseudomonadota bacterium]
MSTRHVRWILAALITLVAADLYAAAPAPLIDLPHSYYYREMYLPQLTSGPSALAWSPDSHELIYSMGGSLWRQKLDSDRAQQLTDGPGYDYQPDWSPDGRYVIFTSGTGESLELWLLDLGSGARHALTHDKAVDLEPRWSPDGKRIVYVSTVYNRHFHVFMADVEGGELRNVVRLTGENRSPLPRYYYSAYDHEINPTWTRDGREVVFLSNRGRIHGTGGLWRMVAEPGAPARELRYEETNWEARPDFSPDGSRLVYSSYLGRNTLQLWLLPGEGGEPFPISYGDWDETHARWSPDGTQIAAISNREGNTAIHLLRIPGGDSRTLRAVERITLHPTGTLHLRITDESGSPTPARVVVTGADGRAYAPARAWMHHAEFDRNEQPFEARYFHTAGEDSVQLPPGPTRVEVYKGLARAPVRASVTIRAGESAEFSAQLPAHPWQGATTRWFSSDVHVHMNYGGHYRNTPAHLVLQAQAEDLDIVQDLIVNKEQRIPDIAYSGHGVDPASTAQTLVVHGQEFHTSYWGHLGLLALRDHVLLPGYAGYPNTAAASLYPTNADVADLAHAQDALVGYVHPFEEEPQPLLHPAHTDADELPVDVALGKVDYMEIVGFSDHRATASVWYRLLNLGFHLPAAGGTDAMADYATLRGPVGLNRVYAALPTGTFSSAAWLQALREGRTFATNGPLLDFTLGGRPIGDTLELDAARASSFTARMHSLVPVDHVQVVCNGKVVRELAPGRGRTELDVSGTVPVAGSGWCVLRAFTEHAAYPVLDNFAYATTSPVYVAVAGRRPRSPGDARFFGAWIGHLRQVTAGYPDWNSAAEKAGVLRQLDTAASVYKSLE